MWVEANSGSGGGGGGETETTLWENTAESYASFSSTTVTLSDNYDNYEKLRIYYRWQGNSASTETSITLPTANFKYDVSQAVVFIGGYYSGSFYARSIRSESRSYKNKLSIGNAYKLNSTATSNGMGVPIKITGIN